MATSKYDRELRFIEIESKRLDEKLRELRESVPSDPAEAARKAEDVTAMEARLADHDFFRSNSCYLVNLRYVAAVEDQDCVMSNGERLRISRPRKKAFLTALADYMGGMQ